MKKTLKLMTFVLGTALLCAPAIAKEKAKKGAKAPAVDEAMMQKWMAYATPSQAHQVLTPLVGSFTHTIKFWMAPNTKPEISTGTSTAQWILGGRFVESKFIGTSMGQPLEGRGFMGYDNEKKQYDGIWLDNMATGVMISHGQYDAATKTLNETCTASCPMEGTKTMRAVTLISDNDNHTYKMYTNHTDGKEFLMMEITYVRVK